MDELKDACEMLKKEYSGIDELYNKYDEEYDYFC